MARPEKPSVRGVQRSSELARILAIPRRVEGSVEDLIDPLSKFLARDHVCKPGCAGGFTRLNEFQTQALAELHDLGRLWVNGPLGVGKTAIGFLCFTILEAHRGLLVIPGGGRDKTMSELRVMREHWRIPQFQLTSFQKIARPSAEFFFYEPPGPYDVVVFDEVQLCSNEDTAVTRRFERLREEAGGTVTLGTRVISIPEKWVTVAMTATPAKDSITDFVHTMDWTHGPLSPLPRNWSEVTDWAGALDANPRERLYPGALTVFSNGNDSLEMVRKGVSKRIFETPGIITSDKSYVDAKLSIHLRNITVGPAEDALFKTLRGDPDDLENFPGWVAPDEDIIADPMEMWRHACSLALGFWTYWDPAPPEGWRIARYDWHHGVREVLKKTRKYDTIQHVANAVDAGHFPDLVEPLARWREIGPTFTQCHSSGCRQKHQKVVDGRVMTQYHSVAVWVGDVALNRAAEWLEGGGIAWTQHTHFGLRLSQITGKPYFEDAGLTLDRKQNIETTTAPGIIASVAANGVMRNLQRYDRNWIASIFPVGRTVEQCIGRTHRQRQKSPLVTVDWAISCREQLLGFERVSEQHTPFYTDLLQIPARMSCADLKSEHIIQSGWAFKPNMNTKAAALESSTAVLEE